MDWTNGTVLRFLELYHTHPCIWDPKHAAHKNKTRLNDSWIDIQANMGVPCTLKELKKKRECLMSAYRGYRTKVKKSETSGASTGDVYQPGWYAFPYMDSFLAPIYKCNPSVSTEGDQSQHVAEDIDENDTEDTNMNNASNSEQGTSSRTPAQRDPPQNDPPQPDRPSQQVSIPKRRMHNPPELQQAKKQMDQAFNILQTVSQQQLNNEEDECQIYGKLIAKKLSKLSDNRRDLLMIKINELIYEENQAYINQNYSSTIGSYNPYRANSSSASYPHTPSPLSTNQQQGDYIPGEVYPPQTMFSSETGIAANYTITTDDCTPNTIYEGAAGEFIIFNKPK